MGFIMKVEGVESFTAGIKVITNVDFRTDTPKDSNARSKDLGAEVKVYGKILTTLEGDPEDSTKKLALWSLVPAESGDSYRKVSIDVIAAGQTVRNVVLPNAFILNYTEDYSDTTGAGTFFLHLRQKKDKTDTIVVSGGYAAAAE